MDQPPEGKRGVRLLPHPTTLTPPRWDDYELLDSGDGQKLERFGPYRLVRPDSQALWSPALPSKEWQRADALFQRSQGKNSSADWVQQRELPEQWRMQHDGLRFWARLTPFRHTGVFPEHSAHWEWMRQCLAHRRQPHVLVLFGYTGLHTLVAAQVGAKVCHVDASRPATRWAQANQELSGLEARPIRWIVDDAAKFVARELRRGSRYDMVIMDPPVFGRGPKGEVWRLTEKVQMLLDDSVALLTDQPAGILINAYATSISPITLANMMQAAVSPRAGDVLAGELVLFEQSAARPLPTALYARWTASR